MFFCCSCTRLSCVLLLIAARFQTFSATAKSLLADAAVVGKVLWAGAVAEMGERDPVCRG